MTDERASLRQDFTGELLKLLTKYPTGIWKINKLNKYLYKDSKKWGIIKLEVIDVKSYPVIIEQDETGYVVSCPVFKGCYSQGDTIDEALKNIKEAIELCIDDEENPVGSIIVGNVVLER